MKNEQTVIAYSLDAPMAVELIAALVVFGYGVDLLLWGDTPPYPWALGFLLIGDFYFRLWRRPVRQARFFEDHFEVSGHGVELKGGYDKIENLKKARAPVGDFATDSRVWFSVRDGTNVLILPNRRSRRRKVDLYSWLQEKSTKTNPATPSRTATKQ